MFKEEIDKQDHHPRFRHEIPVAFPETPEKKARWLYVGKNLPSNPRIEESDEKLIMGRILLLNTLFKLISSILCNQGFLKHIATKAPHRHITCQSKHRRPDLETWIQLGPLFLAIPAAATGPALVIVGVMMCSSITKIDWTDYSEAIPCFFTMLLMPLCYSISEGIMIGVIVYVLMNAFSGHGRSKKISATMWVLAVLFVLRYLTNGLSAAGVF